MPEQPSARRAVRVLIMDDDFELGQQWREGLTAVGFDVTVTGSASEALAVLENESFTCNIAIIDLLVKAPGYSGNEGGLSLLRNLRFSSTERLRKLPIIGVSGYRPLGNIGMAKALMSEFGIQHFLSKPFTTVQLIEAITEVLAPKRR